MKRRGWAVAELGLAWALAAGACGAGGLRALAGQAATPSPALATTTVTDTIYAADGTPATGTVLISWAAFVTGTGANVPAGSTAVAIGANGLLSVALAPNAGSVPIGSYYTVVYHLSDGSTTRQYWVVPVTPAGGGGVRVSAISASVLPASVAMQTVTKDYVDRAVAAVAAAAVSTGVTTGPAATSQPYVLKAGDTMTGPLGLPGDPTAPGQAADKQYVDEQVSGLSAGQGQKVSTVPQATQVVVQPTGTDLEVNRLNGRAYASQYATPGANNGIATALAGPDCSNGCDVVVENSYKSSEAVNHAALTAGTRVEDRRGGQAAVTTLDPLNPLAPGLNSAQTIDLISTRAAAAQFAQNGAPEQFATNLTLTNEALAGGNNEFPQNVQATTPYFKSTYTALAATGTNNTEGQHVLTGLSQNCFGVGDCILGGYYMESSGGFRDNADEGAHPFDLLFTEDPRTYTGTCAGGCTFGSSSIAVSATANAGTQGQGRYLLDVNPAKVLRTGQLTGGGPGVRQAQATFSGTSFPVSVFFELEQAIPTQANSTSPGTVNVAIVSTGTPAGYAGNTAALPATTGIACVADTPNSSAVSDFETANYSVVDATHLQLTLFRPHVNGATVAVGGLCGYGLEQTVDTNNGIRQVFPVIGSDSATSLVYAGAAGAIVGVENLQSAFLNLSLVIAAIARTGNVVSVTTTGPSLQDINGLKMNVTGVSDASYNGVFTVTSTSNSSFTYVDNGPDSTASGGTASYLTGGYALYPMAEARSVYNPATKAVDGLMTLAPNAIGWGTGDPVEQPHYFQQRVQADVEQITQYMPRPALIAPAGIAYSGNNGPGMIGWQISNHTDPSTYFGLGGTHGMPDVGVQVSGPWSVAMDVQAGAGAALSVHCNLYGCNRWDSTYNLLQMDSAAGTDAFNYAPRTSTLKLGLDGTQYVFAPQGFTANTINVTNLNAGTVKGLFTGTVQAASLPLFGASGAAHAAGAVPDPGTSAGATRFLREDGTWSAPAGGNLVSSLSGYQTTGPENLPERAALAGEYLLSEGAGTVAHDTSGQGNDGSIVGAPTWEGTADLDFAAAGGQYIAVPPALNGTRTWQFAIYAPVFGDPKAFPAPAYAQFGNNPSLLCGTTGQQLCLVENSQLTGRSQRFDALTDGTESAETLSAGWHVVTVICGSNINGVVSKSHLLYDGAEVGGYISQGDANTCPNPGTAASAGNFQIGGSALHNGTFWTGKIAAAWAWNKALTLAEASAAADAARHYVLSKGVPPTFRPLSTATPLLVAGLDSRTYGIQLTPATAWPAAMQLTDPSYTRVNLGFPGNQVVDACAAFDLTYGLEVGPNAGPVIAVLWGGVNDYGSQTPRQVANSLRCMVQKFKKLGARVVLATEISAYSPQGTATDTKKDQLDALLRAEAFGWGVDNLADLATDTHVGPDGASSNSACFPDNLHPGPNCEPYITAIFGDAVNELLGSTETLRSQAAAASYTEVAGDRFLDLTGTAAQTVSLPSCVGYSLKREITNLGAAGATVNPVNGETLTGSGSIAAGMRATFIPVPAAPATGGCRWERTQ